MKKFVILNVDICDGFIVGYALIENNIIKKKNPNAPAANPIVFTLSKLKFFKMFIFIFCCIYTDNIYYEFIIMELWTSLQNNFY